jgi:hypothetical protein
MKAFNCAGVIEYSGRDANPLLLFECFFWLYGHYRR